MATSLIDTSGHTRINLKFGQVCLILDVWLPAYTSYRLEKHARMPSAREPETQRHTCGRVYEPFLDKSSPCGHCRRDSSELTGDGRWSWDETQTLPRYGST